MARRRRRKTNLNFFSSFFGALLGLFRAFFGFVFRNFFVIAFVVALGLGGFGIFKYCFYSNAFLVNRIELNSLKYHSRDKLLGLASLKYGVNIFSVDLAEASMKIEKLPRIKKVEISRVLPATIRLKITERSEVAQVKLPFRNKYYLIDREGVILDPVLGEPKSNLIVIKAKFSRKSFLQPGDSFFSQAIENSFLLIEYCLSKNVFSGMMIVAVNIDNNDSLDIVLSNSVEVKVGTSLGSVFSKLDQLKEILKTQIMDKIKYIDLRFNDIVIK